MKKAESKRKRFNELFHDSMSKPGVSLPPENMSKWAMARFAQETSRRAARCRICNQAIEARDLRIIGYVRHRRVFTNGGGHSSGDRYQYHIDCMAGALGITEAATPDPYACYSCRKNQGTYPLHIAHGAPYGRICDVCLNGPATSYASCALCGGAFQTRQLHIADPDQRCGTYWDSDKPIDVSRKPVCEHCVVNYNVKTAKRRKAEQREERNTWKLAAHIKETIADWTSS